MKIGLIGCGGMGTTHNLSLKALSQIMNIEVTAIADCRNEYLEKAAEYWERADKYTLGMDLIDNANVDVVYICLPSYLHADHAIAAMKKGYDIFLEKPACLTNEDCTRLLEAQKRYSSKIMIGQVVRFFDEYQFLKRMYNSKKYGKLKSIVMHRLSGDVTWGFENWFHDIKKSGSVILDLHIHDMDFLRYMVGEPDSFQVNTTCFENGMPNQVITRFMFGDVFALVEGAWDVSSKLPFEANYRACFEDATIVFNSLTEPHIAVYHKDGNILIPKLNTEYDVNDNSAGINITNLGAYYTEDKYFLNCLLNNEPIEIAPLSEGVKSVKLGLEELKQGISK